MQKGLGTDQGKTRCGTNYFYNCPFAGSSKDVVRPRTSDDIDYQEICPSRALLTLRRVLGVFVSRNEVHLIPLRAMHLSWEMCGRERCDVCCLCFCLLQVEGVAPNMDGLGYFYYILYDWYQEPIRCIPA